MNSLDISVEQKSVGKCLLDNWVEERATVVVDTNGPRSEIQKNGHRGILSMDMSSKVQGVTTVNAAFTPPKGPGVRQRGIRGELLEKFLFKEISEQTHAEFNPEPPKTDFCSTTHKDFNIEGFQSYLPKPTKEHDFNRDQAITFWIENHPHIQGMTSVRTRDTPFKKNASFSTPVSEQLDDPVLYTQEN